MFRHTITLSKPGAGTILLETEHPMFVSSTGAVLVVHNELTHVGTLISSFDGLCQRANPGAVQMAMAGSPHWTPVEWEAS